MGRGDVADIGFVPRHLTPGGYRSGDGGYLSGASDDAAAAGWEDDVLRLDAGTRWTLRADEAQR